MSTDTGAPAGGAQPNGYPGPVPARVERAAVYPAPGPRPAAPAMPVKLAMPAAPAAPATPAAPAWPAVPATPAALAQPAGPATPAGDTGGAVSGPIADQLAELLAGVLDVERVPLDGHFFDDLDADSMVMARFCARVRKRADLPDVSMQDIYRNSTIGALAAALAPPADAPHQVVPTVPAPVEITPEGSTARYLTCGALQLLIALGMVYLGALVLEWGFEWIRPAAADPVQTYLRALVFTVGGFLITCLLPVLAKWVLIGRWWPQRIQVWTLAYVRFWVVKSLMRVSPMSRYVGSPLYPVYLRMMGARIGRGVVFQSPAPVCTDLLTVGDGTIVRKDVLMTGYRALAGTIVTGPITLGRDVFVGEQSLLDIGTSIGDGGQLGHASSLHLGQHVPPGQLWHGSPAVRTGTDYRGADPARCGDLRRVLYTLWQLIPPLVLVGPLLFGGSVLLINLVPQLSALLAAEPLQLSSPAYYQHVALVSLAVFLGGLALGLLVVMTIPRLLNLLLRPGRTYPLYGVHYMAARTITRLTNSQAFLNLFGDSSYVVHYLRWLGYDLGDYEQTGSNFGTRVKHDIPYRCSIGRGTMVADGLSMINIDYSSTSFRVADVVIGPQNFLGNNIVYPSQGRTGQNCLLATKVMVPIEGPVRQDSGLLGAPSFPIPRTVDRDRDLDVTDPAERRRRLRAKNRHNTVTIALYLASRWCLAFVAVLLAATALDLYAWFGEVAVALFGVGSVLLSVPLMILLERSVTRLHALRPQGCSIYDRDFWRHERYWKVPGQQWMQAFNGTPLKPLMWRALGVRIGRRVFDDGCWITERAFTTIGDDCTLNVGSGVQCHSQEDGAFKSDRTVLGSRVTLGVGAFVHYGVTIGEDAVVAPHSFLMKGEEVGSRTRWSGVPARIVQLRRLPPSPTDPMARDVVQLMQRTTALEHTLRLQTRQIARAQRRTALMALLSAACLAALVLLATPLGSGWVPAGWRTPVGGAPAASATPAHAREAPDADVEPAGADAVGVVRGFYSLLPADTATAYTLLTPQFQQALGGTTGFTRLYQGVVGIQVLGEPVVVRPDTVTATVRVQRRGASIADERYEYTVGPGPDGGLSLAGWRRLP